MIEKKYHPELIRYIRQEKEETVIFSYPVVCDYGVYNKHVIIKPKSELQKIRDEHPRLMKAFETGKFEE